MDLIHADILQTIFNVGILDAYDLSNIQRTNRKLRDLTKQIIPGDNCIVKVKTLKAINTVPKPLHKNISLVTSTLKGFNHSSLIKLELSDYTGLVIPPMPNIKYIVLKSCTIAQMYELNELISLKLNSVKSDKPFRLINLPKLKCLHAHHLTNITLDPNNYNNLECYYSYTDHKVIQNLPNLKYIYVMGCEDLINLPSLENINCHSKITNCPNIKHSNGAYLDYLQSFTYNHQVINVTEFNVRNLYMTITLSRCNITYLQVRKLILHIECDYIIPTCLYLEELEIDDHKHLEISDQPVLKKLIISTKYSYYALSDQVSIKLNDFPILQELHLKCVRNVNLNRFNTINELTIFCCHDIIFDSLSNIKKLHVREHSLKGFKHVDKLEHLKLVHCTHIDGIEKAPNLYTLDLEDSRPSISVNLTEKLFEINVVNTVVRYHIKTTKNITIGNRVKYIDVPHLPQLNDIDDIVKKYNI